MEIDNKQLLESFKTETGEGLEQMEEALLELEAHPNDTELVNTIFRVVHTFKGNAKIFELKHAQEFAHVLEDLLDRLRTHELAFSPDIADVLLASIDVMREFTAAGAEGRDTPAPKSKKLLHRMKGQIERKLKARKNSSEPEIEPADGASASMNLVAAPQSARTLRVDVHKLDRLLDLTGEIGIAWGRVTRLFENREQMSVENLAEAHNMAGMLQAELQELVMKVRMVPVGPLFRQYQRTVRDLGKELGKTVNLEIEGGDVEVDTSVVEHLRDPLMHMIRNAMDHGIETPEQRQQAGKPPAGTITLRASHQHGSISVEVEDDGAGLDRTEIIEAAKKRGVHVDPGLSDHDVYQMVFESGLSTTGQVSNLSGRGVGMDVVRRKVQALRGNVSISSRPGLGTTVYLRFPLTLAIIEGFAVEVGANTYVIPLEQVVECIELPGEARDSEYSAGVLKLRGEPVPYLQLRDHFQLPGPRALRQNVVVVQHGAKRAGLAVDALSGAAQTVIKPLPHLFKDVPGVSGSAILGSGRVALILDVSALLRSFEEAVSAV
jgi:two-component system, chemotaxis family, sensor kinase CheA